MAPQPMPAPAPAPTFPLAASASFDTIFGNRVVHTQPVTGAITLESLGVEGRSSDVTIGYDAASGTYTVRDAASSATFGPSDRGAPSGFLDIYTKQAGTAADQLQLFGNARPGASQAGAPVQLTYLSYGIWSHTDSQLGETRKTYFLFGFPTAASDMPRSGSASYQTAVAGHMLEVGFSGGETELGGSASFDVNFGTGAINTQLTLNRAANQAPVGTFVGTGTITADQFAGSFTSSTPNFVSGSFAGGFFGPAAKEMGYDFSISKHNPDPFAGASPQPTDAWIVGVVVGTKK